MVAVALAGPGMNLALATIAAVALGGLAAVSGAEAAPTGITGFVFANLVNFLLVNVFLALFNLLPLPPFDGGHVVAGVLPRPLAREYAKLARFGFLLVILLIVVVPMAFPSANIVERIVVPPAQWVVNAFMALASAIG